MSAFGRGTARRDPRNTLPHRRRQRPNHGRIVFGTDTLTDLDARPPPRKEFRPEPEQVGPESSKTEEQLQRKVTIVFRSWEEWKGVKHDMFRQTRDGLEAARATLEIWKLRSVPKRAKGSDVAEVPPYVEATLWLMNAHILDTELLGNKPFVTEARVITEYCIAISRSVHHLLHKLAVGTSESDATYRDAARSLGMPEEITEARNDIAHSRIPSLSELRWVSSMALEYLFQEYWVFQEENIAPPKLRKSEEPVLANISLYLGGQSQDTPQLSTNEVLAAWNRLSTEPKRNTSPFRIIDS